VVAEVVVVEDVEGEAEVALFSASIPFFRPAEG
jgi:hypothetical protein